MGRHRVKGKGTVAEGLLIWSISEESPISNIKDESDRSEDDPDRSKRIQAMTEAKEGRSQGYWGDLKIRWGSDLIWDMGVSMGESRLSIMVGNTRVCMWEGTPGGVCQSHVSLDWVVRGRREWMMIGGQRQASWPWLCWGQLTRARAWSHDTGVVEEGVEGTMGENKGKAEGNWGRRGRVNVL